MGTIIAARAGSGRARPTGEDVSRGTPALEAWRPGPRPTTDRSQETRPRLRALPTRVPSGRPPPLRSRHGARAGLRRAEPKMCPIWPKRQMTEGLDVPTPREPVSYTHLT